MHIKQNIGKSSTKSPSHKGIPLSARSGHSAHYPPYGICATNNRDQKTLTNHCKEILYCSYTFIGA